jgi:hypothetical protein
MRLNKKIALAILTLILSACNPYLNTGNIENSSSVMPDSELKALDQEYSAFATKALSQNYFNRKLNKWITENKGTNLLRELKYAQQKHPDLALNFFKSDNIKYNMILATPEIITRMAADIPFSNFINFAAFISSGLILNLDSGNTASYPGSGTTWTDTSGNSDNATLINGPGFDTSNGGSITFDGFDDYATITSSSIFNLGTSSFTFSCFIKSNNFSSDIFYRRIFSLGSQGNSNDNFQVVLDIATGAAYMWTTTGQLDTIGTINVTDNQWHNVVVTRDSNLFTLYVDGNPDVTQTFTGTLSNQGSSPVLGRYGPDNIGRFAGNISTILLYNKALTSTEVKQNFNAVKSRYEL